MSETNNPNLVGWAAIITAIAALITAIGFPSFFPDLVKNSLPSEPITQDKNPTSPNTNKEKPTSPQEPDAIQTPESRDGNVPNTIRTLKWNDTASGYWRNLGQYFTFNCPSGGAIDTIYGTDIYTYDSSICTAAVHSGLIAPEYGGQVTIRIEPRQEFYQESFRYGVESREWGKYDGSFSFPGRGEDLIPL
jgi:hypothetical protein